VIKTLVPRVDADGNELGGVPTVQRDAPLGTYLGWNITAGPGEVGYDGKPFHAGQVCNYIGGMVPFFKTEAQRRRRAIRACRWRSAMASTRLRRRGDCRREQCLQQGLSARGRPRCADRTGEGKRCVVQQFRPGHTDHAQRVPRSGTLTE